MAIEYATNDFVPNPTLVGAVFRRDRAFAVLPHYHAFDELVFVLRGTGTHVVNGEARSFRAGDVLVVRAGQCHYYRDVSGFALASVIIVPERLKAADPSGRLAEIHAACFGTCGKAVSHISLEPDSWHQAQRLTMALESAQLAAEGECLAATLGTLLECLVSGSADTSPAMCLHTEIETAALVPSLAHLETHYQDADVLRPLTDLAHMSERTLLRRFHQVTGRSPVAYLGDLRMHHAMLELRKSRASITDIALSSGFGDLSYFHRRFQSITGETPRRWRNRQRHEW